MDEQTLNELEEAAHKVVCRENGTLQSDLWESDEEESRDYQIVAKDYLRLHPACDWDFWDMASDWCRAHYPARLEELRAQIDSTEPPTSTEAK